MYSAKKRRILRQIKGIREVKHVQIRFIAIHIYTAGQNMAVIHPERATLCRELCTRKVDLF